MQKPLGVHIDYKLKFDTHIETLCSRWEKSCMHALALLIMYMSADQA